MEAEKHQVRTIDGWQLVLRRYRGERPVLLVHGMGANSYNFDLNPRLSLARYLAARGFDCWVAELRGRGESQPPPGGRRDWNFEDLLHGDVVALVDYIEQQQPGPLHWIGHSMGGMLGLAYAICYGGRRLRSQVLFGTPLGFDASQHALRFWGWMAQAHRLLPTIDQEKLGRRFLPVIARGKNILKFFLRYLANPDNIDEPTALDIFRKLVTNESPGLVLQFSDWVRRGVVRSADGSFAYSQYLCRVTCPLLLVWGKNDLMAPAEVNSRLASSLGSCCVKRVVLDRASGFSADYGHGDLALGVNAPDEVYPLVAEWLEKLP